MTWSYFAARFFYCLFCMLNGVTYIEVEIQSTVPYDRTLSNNFWELSENYKYNFTSKFLEHWNKLQEVLSVLCGYFFNLNGIAIMEEENISLFLLSKMYEINFHYQLFARVCLTKREQSVWKWESILNNRYCPGNWAKYKILHIYLSRLLLKF